MLLVDLEVTCSGGDDGEREAGADKVAIDIVLVERVDRQINDLEKVALMSLRRRMEPDSARRPERGTPIDRPRRT